MSSSPGWTHGQPYGATVAGEAVPPKYPEEFIQEQQGRLELRAVPVLMQSACKTQEDNLERYLQELRGEVRLVPFEKLGKACNQGAIRAYYRLPADFATMAGQTVELGVKIAVGLGTRVLQVPNASQQAYANSCRTVAGGNFREYRLSHLSAFGRFVDKRLLPEIHGLVIWVLERIAPASYEFSGKEMSTGEVLPGWYDFIGFAAAFFEVSPADAYERMFPRPGAGGVSLDTGHLDIR